MLHNYVMEDLPKRKTDRLYRGRVSITGARYFVTLTTDNRVRCLQSSETQRALLKQMETQMADGDLINECAVVMHDHVHWLFELTGRLPLGRVIAKFKRFSPSSVAWQRDFFEHRLRPFEFVEAYGKYIFMNPYRANLVAATDVYTGTRFWRQKHYLFLQSLTAPGCPQPQWLAVAGEHPVEVFCRARLDAPAAD